MSRKVRENILVTKNNLPFLTAGTSLFLNASGRKPPKLAVQPGQPFLVDPKTYLAINPATFDRAVHPNYILGVGVDLDGDGIAETYRSAFGEIFSDCKITDINSDAPACGVSEVVDLLFGCTGEDQTYSLNVFVDDDTTQNQFPYNRPDIYTFSARVNSSSCSGCEAPEVCDTLVDNFVDAINGDAFRDVDIRLQGTFLPRDPVPLPFTAAKLYTSSFTLTVTPAAGVCNGCKAITGLQSFTYLPVGGTAPGDTETVVFTNNVNPANAEETLIGQLPGIVDQINAALQADGAPGGSAILVGSPGDCCGLRIEINAPLDAAGFIDWDDEAVATVESNPFTGSTYTCGIRLIAREVEIECNCQYPANPVKGYLARHIKIYTASGFDKAGVTINKVQNTVYPKNLGYHWQYREYQSDNGGMGREHNNYNDQYGRLRVPGPDDRANSTVVDCKQTYCSFIFEHGLQEPGNGVFDRNAIMSGRTILLVPSGDTTTVTAVEGFLSNYADSAGACSKSFTSLTCGE